MKHLKERQSNFNAFLECLTTRQTQIALQNYALNSGLNSNISTYDLIWLRQSFLAHHQKWQQVICLLVFVGEQQIYVWYRRYFGDQAGRPAFG